MASVHADGGVDASRHRARRRQLPRRQSRASLPRRCQLAVVQRAWAPSSAARSSAARTARAHGALDVPRAHARAGIRLGAALLELAPPGLTRVFYSDSGSTAVEIALKQSFQYWQLRGRPRKQRFLRPRATRITATRSARSGLAASICFTASSGRCSCRALRSPPAAGTDGAASLARSPTSSRRRADDIAAFIFEPLIQGAAGMLVHPRGFLARSRQLCRRHDVHLILDEVATGFGRTGTMFACEQEQVSPDFLCLAKGISGGYLPLAATLTTRRDLTARSSVGATSSSTSSMATRTPRTRSRAPSRSSRSPCFETRHCPTHARSFPCLRSGSIESPSTPPCARSATADSWSGSSCTPSPAARSGPRSYSCARRRRPAAPTRRRGRLDASAQHLEQRARPARNRDARGDRCGLRSSLIAGAAFERQLDRIPRTAWLPSVSSVLAAPPQRGRQIGASAVLSPGATRRPEPWQHLCPVARTSTKGVGSAAHRGYAAEAPPGLPRSGQLTGATRRRRQRFTWNSSPISYTGLPDTRCGRLPSQSPGTTRRCWT